MPPVDRAIANALRNEAGRIRRGVVAGPPDGLVPGLAVDRGPHPAGALAAEPARARRPADDDGRGRRADDKGPRRRRRDGPDPAQSRRCWPRRCSPSTTSPRAGPSSAWARASGSTSSPTACRSTSRSARLSEGIDILRLLWESDGKPVNFEGRFHRLENAVLGHVAVRRRPARRSGPPRTARACSTSPGASPTAGCRRR